MDDTQVSKFLALVLRHHPEAAGIALDEHGWADVQELVAGVSRKMPLDLERLERIVREDAKQRYAFSEDHTRIRANQGHSVAVALDWPRTAPPATRSRC